MTGFSSTREIVELTKLLFLQRHSSLKEGINSETMIEMRLFHLGTPCNLAKRRLLPDIHVSQLVKIQGKCKGKIQVPLFRDALPKAGERRTIESIPEHDFSAEI